MTKPVLKQLEPDDSLNGFDCGDPEVNEYLTRDGMDQQRRRYTRIYVVCLENRVIAYSALACYHLFMHLPDDETISHRVPGIILGQLGVHREYQGKGLGYFLIDHAISVGNKISESAACRILFAEAHDDKMGYYSNQDFEYVTETKSGLKVMCYDLEKSRERRSDDLPASDMDLLSVDNGLD